MARASARPAAHQLRCLLGWAFPVVLRQVASPSVSPLRPCGLPNQRKSNTDQQATVQLRKSIGETERRKNRKVFSQQ
jgi:hypothetical protein